MIVVHVTYKMKPGTKEQYIKEVQDAKIDQCGRKDPGNIVYDNYYSAFRDDEVILYEMWEDEASLLAHQTTPHNIALQDIKKKYVLETSIKRVDGVEKNWP
ncbi:putative quinol monooxygenase [Bacilliculturomica massiliensis]|uniref:putative quinol monooxygenase n=1 Tax=Bacilliculturomica massiliensis TaxID=1917867 RepID=UPI00103078A1|nr:antibiotic biosynthesis monooxygenase [Bacilliculturomica massiliensis]